MKNRYGAVSAVLLSLCICGCLLLAGCGPGKEAAVTVSDRGVSHEEEFGGVYIDLAIDDFNALGFAYGDSVDISFSNGYTLTDVPYYNGYYTQIGEPLLVAYPGYPYIKAAINNGACLWEVSNMTDDATATIRINTPGKDLDVQKARDIHYSDKREDYDSDVIFANFRTVDTGNIKAGKLFRSASPCDNSHNRAPFVDKLISEAGVNIIVDLADTDQKIEGYIAKDDFDSPYFLSLYNADKVIPLGMNTHYTAQENKEKLASGLLMIADNEGPYLVHCTEGKDRTGFICILLEALCGASYKDILDDYMETYDNYYKINGSSDKERYDLIVKMNLDDLIETFVGSKDVDIKTAPLEGYAKDYIKSCGLTDEEIGKIVSNLT